VLIALRVVVVLAVVLVGLWFLGPREPVGLSPVAAFPSASADLDAWLAEREANHDDLTDGVAKEIVWRDPTSRERTPVSKAAGSALLTMPFARQLVPLLVGEYREWEPHNRDHGVYWTNRYPNLALLPMAASVAAAGDIAFESLAVPAFFVFSDADQVVDASVTRKVASRWGGEVALFPVDVEPPNDPYSHVIAGDILSPTLTAPLVEATRDWLVETLDL